MRLTTNAALIKRRLRTSFFYFFLSTALMGGGFLLTVGHQDELVQDPARYAVATGALLVGLAVWAVNQNYLSRWSPRGRQDPALTRALRGLDDRYHFFAFPDAKLPDYLLVGPMGVVILVSRATTGIVSCDGDRWRRVERIPLILRALTWFSRTAPLGNPTTEARRATEQTQRFLNGALTAELAEKVPVEAIVVFTAPDMDLSTRGCTTPVLRTKALRPHLRTLPKELKPEDLRQLTAALGATA